MLIQILHEITESKDPVSLSTLSLRLGIEPSALEGMLNYWVRKGRLKSDDNQPAGQTCSLNCGSSCAQAGTCVFVAKIPKRYSLPEKAKDDDLVS